MLATFRSEMLLFDSVEFTMAHGVNLAIALFSAPSRSLSNSETVNAKL